MSAVLTTKTTATSHPAVASFIAETNRQLANRKPEEIQSNPLSNGETRNLQRLFKAGYLPRLLQELVYVKNPEWTTIAEQTELRRWLAMPACQAALPILLRMELEKAKAKKRKGKQSKAKKREGELL